MLSPDSQPDDSLKWYKRVIAPFHNCTPASTNEPCTKIEDFKEEEDRERNLSAYFFGNVTLPTVSNHPHMQVWVLWWCVRSSLNNTFQKVHQRRIPGLVIRNKKVLLIGVSQGVYLLGPIIVVQGIVENKPTCCRTTKTNVEWFIYK